MATSSNPLAPDVETDIDNPEVHQHRVPIVNIEEPEEEEENERLEVKDGEERAAS
jgi:hypothetical protein